MALTSRVLILRENMYFVEYVTPLDALFFYTFVRSCYRSNARRLK